MGFLADCVKLICNVRKYWRFDTFSCHISSSSSAAAAAEAEAEAEESL